MNAAMATTTASLLMMALFLRRWGRTSTGEENELGHSPLGGHCKRKERRPKPTPLRTVQKAKGRITSFSLRTY